MAKQEWIEKAKEKEDAAKNLVLQLAQTYRDSPEIIAEFLQFGANFYKYSYRNTELIYAQNPFVTFVQSYAEWKKMGYSPKRGEHGLSVWVPMQVTYLKTGEEAVQLKYATREQKAAYKRGELESYQRTYYKIGTVFDISQTNFPPEKYPELFSAGYESAGHGELYSHLKEYIEQHDCPVSEMDTHSIALRGTYTPGNPEIRINEIMKDTQKLSTLTHEWGHHVMITAAGGRNQSSAQEELEGDAFSVMLQSHFGLEIPDTRKRHLAQQYQQLLKENTQDEIENMLANVFQQYRRIVPELDEFIEKRKEKSVMETMKKDEMTLYGSVVKELREQKGMTETEFAYMCMVSPDTLKEIEAGSREADNVTLLMMANVLGVSTSALEQGKIVPQTNQKEITSIMKEIQNRLQDTRENNEYIKEFMERNGIPVELDKQYAVAQTNEQEIFAVYDTETGTYVLDEKGRTREWEDIADARAFADNLNQELTEQEKAISHVDLKEAEISTKAEKPIEKTVSPAI